jgi:Tfp pilus assembly protein PilF
MTAALELLRPALTQFKSSPLVSAAAGIYYTTDIDSLARAQEMLRMAIELRAGASATLDLAHPPDAWTPMLQGLVKAANRGGEDDARAAFEAAVRKEPRLARAKLELVKLLDHQGKRDDAKKLAAEILAQVPTHAKARAYLDQNVSAPTPAVTPVAKDDKEASDAAAKTKRTRPKRKR